MLEKLTEMEKVIEDIKERINEQKYVRIVTHHDPDGLSSGSILAKLLLRENKLFQITVVEHLSKNVIDKLSNKYFYIFADMGSGQIEELLNKDIRGVIIDHHPPAIKETHVKDIIQLNPHIFGIDGAKEATASGMCYLLARAYKYYDLSGLAIVGIIGDMQYSPLLGINKFIVNEAREYRHIKIFEDIIYNVYNIELYKAIAYCTKPYIPDLASEVKAYNFLKSLNIDPEKKELTWDESKKLISALIFKYPKADRLKINRIIINHKVKDAFLLSEMLNSVGRHGLFGVGIGIGLEDDKCIERGYEILWEYKKKLIKEIKETKLRKLKNIYYFEGKKGFIGIIASILAEDKPVIGYYIEGDIAKFSARGNKELIERGLDLNEAMAVAKEFDGSGGGHNIAAGATIPKDKIEEFLKRVDEIIGGQLSKG
ncbi:phosphoesterase RecJ domain-containing protein [Methanocaldococcus villosus KIN24-T80]|uniref:Phosphoesterase RecJ domain-containing protein n=1 Tax=Methanocaldococcus villosus KIN24-T80 TaxID=1069083 RepID=N6VTK0_9EURY|nr:DHH family phosphoesterase [Methanocaldococcus villosus]ENN96501.1 phosphoesterase RecJ domain-containing protein [Methanocaldococcus villosus KIN24-T80]